MKAAGALIGYGLAALVLAGALDRPMAGAQTPSGPGSLSDRKGEPGKAPSEAGKPDDRGKAGGGKKKEDARAGASPTRPTTEESRARPVPEKEKDKDDDDDLDTDEERRWKKELKAKKKKPKPVKILRPKARYGLMIGLGLGVNGCTDTLCSAAEPLMDLKLHVLARLGRYFAAGLQMAFLFNYKADVSKNGIENDTRAFWSLLLAAEARLVLPYRNADFWLGALMGYYRWMYQYTYSDSNGSSDVTDYFNAFVLGGGLGFDYFVHRRFLIGFSFYLYKPIAREVCVDKEMQRGELCSSDRKNDIGIWWSLGITFTYYLPF